MFSRASLIACTAAALVSICQSSLTPPAPSPCPELFTYESIDNPGYWTGSLTLRPDYDLRGIWIRLIFDKEVKDLTVDPKFNIIYASEDKKIVKLQNPDLVVAAEENRILSIKVTYEGSETPSLIEYRLNARTICPQADFANIGVFEGDIKSDHFLQSLQTKRPTVPTRYDCGVPLPSNQHPWQAAVYLRHNKKEVYTCDAVLIDPSYLITAAHCVTVKNETKAVPTSIVSVRFGETGDAGDAPEKYLRDIIVHPGYEFGSLADDIAVLRLVNPAEKFRPICLGAENGPEQKIIISGYELGNDGEVGKVLDADVFRVDSKECSTRSPELHDILTYDTCCVSYKSGDEKCVGNSGSGLVSVCEGKATLRGLVSLSARLQQKSNCDDKTNIIVTDIERYLSFIDNNVY